MIKATRARARQGRQRQKERHTRAVLSGVAADLVIAPATGAGAGYLDGRNMGAGTRIGKVQASSVVAAASAVVSVTLALTGRPWGAARFAAPAMAVASCKAYQAAYTAAVGQQVKETAAGAGTAGGGYVGAGGAYVGADASVDAGGADERVDRDTAAVWERIQAMAVDGV